jgi:Zn-dependent peptidase ImmA (M78 family)
VRESRAARTAARIADLHGSNPWMAANALEVPVLREPLPAPCRELYFNLPDAGPAIIVVPGADEPEASALVAHGLGHHVLHCGNRLAAGGLRVWNGQHEREANDFAAALLLPAHLIESQLARFDSLPLPALADDLGVTIDVLRRRIEMLNRDLSCPEHAPA